MHRSLSELMSAIVQRVRDGKIARPMSALEAARDAARRLALANQPTTVRDLEAALIAKARKRQPII